MADHPGGASQWAGHCKAPKSDPLPPLGGGLAHCQKYLGTWPRHSGAEGARSPEMAIFGHTFSHTQVYSRAFQVCPPPPGLVSLPITHLKVFMVCLDRPVTKKQFVVVPCSLLFKPSITFTPTNHHFFLKHTSIALALQT